MNWIDTAALYGLGHSEDMVARAIQDRSPKPYVFTKCERVWDKNRNIGACLKAASVRRECEDSLRRLKIDSIDLYQIHWPEPDRDIEEGWTELARLKEEGSLDWRVQFQRRSNEACASHCANYFVAASLCGRAAGD